MTLIKLYMITYIKEFFINLMMGFVCVCVCVHSYIYDIRYASYSEAYLLLENSVNIYS